jgi:hypothetical protein
MGRQLVTYWIALLVSLRRLIATCPRLLDPLRLLFLSGLRSDH